MGGPGTINLFVMGTAAMKGRAAGADIGRPQKPGAGFRRDGLSGGVNVPDGRLADRNMAENFFGDGGRVFADLSRNGTKGQTLPETGFNPFPVFQG